MIVPRGIILLWYGAVGTIPDGWLLCDGTHGTPDLRDKFIVGAGGVYSKGDTGGSSTHNHNFTSDGHFHTLPLGEDIEFDSYARRQSDTKTDSGTTDAGSSLPPYHALCWIMKS